MALARVKTWNPGDTLTAADLNAEFNNPLNNPISLISPTTGAINFQTSVLHTNLALSALNTSSGSTGYMPYVSATGGPVWAGGPPLSSVRGLFGNVSTGQTVALSWEQCVLQTTAAIPALYSMTSTVTFTLNAGTAGPAALGRDQAGVFASTFVYAYAISTGLNSTVPSGILSTNQTVPTLPTSYTAYALLGAYLYSSASTSFSRSARVRGSWVWYEGSPVALISGGVATVETSVNTANDIPITALNGVFAIETVNGTTGNVVLNPRVITGLNFQNRIVTAANDYTDVIWLMPNVSQNIFYLYSSSPGAGNGLTIIVSGYQMPNGGE